MGRDGTRVKIEGKTGESGLNERILFLLTLAPDAAQ